MTVQGLKLQPGASHLRFHGFTVWRAEFTRALWRFVDGVEFLFDDNGRRIDIRSASWVGYSDLGVNRRRIKDIRRWFSGP